MKKRRLFGTEQVRRLFGTEQDRNPSGTEEASGSRPGTEEASTPWSPEELDRVQKEAAKSGWTYIGKSDSGGMLFFSRIPSGTEEASDLVSQAGDGAE